jgi:N utilization substance protein B
MQALYAHQLAGGDEQHFIETILKPDLSDDEANFRFASKLFLRTLDYLDIADEIIATHAQNWELSRIALIDRLLLAMAICEFLAFEDIPPKVSINEAIEVAKKYSTSRSGKFINGILDAVLLQLQREGRLNKSGRGLVGMETIRNRIVS